ncbi:MULTISPECIES: GNAT family N-acetyltransferase [Alphaproteobacteria]|uniref:Acetyltransferase n=2 Tax=Alphaproteobacteria TaxID=28211 RepID=A0A512HJE6_9HYPH|nr:MULTISPECIES: GNAT family N-acetyltransferase [Alphaproteobacteria]GEO85578.1 acetyltransferase [Ciceribacter naphthalenivorans]GLR22067.1 acetyltransferase [Ciceribacter naphthalenivorans]GLT04923.1 acetyltransferase [Sphingomonas psychrolutea]
MSANITVEKPETADVLELIDRSDAYIASLYPPEGNFTVDVGALRQPDISFVVARTKGQAVGCGAIKWLEDGTAELKRIFVADEARGKGIGRQIMTTLLEMAEVHGIECLYLETGPRNTEAVSLYQTLGFRECGPFAGYQENPYSLFMARQLVNA